MKNARDLTVKDVETVNKEHLNSMAMLSSSETNTSLNKKLPNTAAQD